MQDLELDRVVRHQMDSFVFLVVLSFDQFENEIVHTTVHKGATRYFKTEDDRGI